MRASLSPDATTTMSQPGPRVARQPPGALEDVQKVHTDSIGRRAWQAEGMEAEEMAEAGECNDERDDDKQNNMHAAWRGRTRYAHEYNDVRSWEDTWLSHTAR